MQILVPVVVAALVAHAGVWAQQPAEKPARPSVRAVGEATVSARPDQARIDIGVVTQAPTAQAAATLNAKQLDGVLNDLRTALGKSVRLQTTSFSLQPDYRHPRDGGRPTITGYTARNIVQVETNDLGSVGKLIDLVTQSGANTIQGLHYMLRDPQAVREQALQEAVKKARANADAMASALGVKIVRVLSIEQSESPPVRPMMAMARMAEMAAAPPTPTEPGTIDVSANVVLTVELSQ
jgi:uncharacterized protein YggE